jgi:hypothetical protein
MIKKVTSIIFFCLTSLCILSNQAIAETCTTAYCRYIKSYKTIIDNNKLSSPSKSLYKLQQILDAIDTQNEKLDEILSNASEPSIINNNTYTTNDNDTKSAGGLIGNLAGALFGGGLFGGGHTLGNVLNHSYATPTPPVAPHAIPTSIITPTHSTSTHVIKW